jgi:CBS domain-containing protein
MIMQVKDIMAKPIIIDKSEKLSRALDLMDKFETRRLLVMHNEDIQGIVTMRSITRELGTRKKSNLPASAMHVITATSNNYNKVFPDMPVIDGIVLMNKNNGILLVMDNKSVIGWVTPQEIIMNYPIDNFFAGETMWPPVIIGPGERVIHARRIMLDNDISRLLVLENGSLVGIITENDIANSLRAFRDIVSGSKQDNRIKNLLVEDIMTRGVISVKTNTPIKEVIDIILEKNLGGMPVVNLKGEVVGVITRRSLIETISEKI